MSLSQAKKLVGKESSLIPAPDEVSTSDIRHWREIMEGEKKSWDTSTAPPTMTSSLPPRKSRDEVCCQWEFKVEPEN